MIAKGVAQFTGQAGFLDFVAGSEDAGDVAGGGFILHAGEIFQHLHGALGHAVVDDAFPCGMQFRVGVHTDHAHDEADGIEHGGGALWVVGESLGFFKGGFVAVAHASDVVGRVQIMSHGQSAQGVVQGAAGFADAVAPQLLPGISEHEFHEGGGEFGIGRTAQHANGIHADRGATQWRDEAHA